jgi:hypothetical protein
MVKRVASGTPFCESIRTSEEQRQFILTGWSLDSEDQLKERVADELCTGQIADHHRHCVSI